MKRLVALAVMALVLATGLTAVAQDTNAAKIKEALNELGEFIGEWNGAGGPVGSTKGIWKEKIDWGWKFKGDDAWLVVKFTDGKLYKSGDLKYDPATKKYNLSLVGVDGKTREYKGEFKKSSSTLSLEGTDPDTKDTLQLVMNSAAEGVRLIYQVNRKPEGGTLVKKEYKVEASKEGQGLGKVDKKNLCVVSGGQGTSTIAYKGVNYYICCSGCRDAFNETPDKFVKEFEEKKKKMK